VDQRKNAYIGSRWPMTLVVLSHSLWMVRFLLQAALLAWMVVRRFYREFPFFVLYTADAVFQAVILKATNMSPAVSPSQRFATYAGGAVLGAALGFAVTYEVFRQAFRNYPALRRLGTTLFRGAAVCFLLFTTFALLWSSSAAARYRLMAKVDVFVLTVCVMQCGLVVILLRFSKGIGVSLRSRTFGIALGFGILSSVDLAAFAIRARIEPTHPTLLTDLLNVITLGAYLCSVAVWAAYVVRPETAVATSSSAVLPAHEMKDWNEELQRLLRQ
jgi:hypothetical protein